MRDVHKSISIPSTATKTHHQGAAGAFPRLSVPHQRPEIAKYPQGQSTSCTRKGGSRERKPPAAFERASLFPPFLWTSREMGPSETRRWGEGAMPLTVHLRRRRPPKRGAVGAIIPIKNCAYPPFILWTRINLLIFLSRNIAPVASYPQRGW